MNDDDARRCLHTLRRQRDNPVALDHGLIGSADNQVGHVGWHVAPRMDITIARHRARASVHSLCAVTMLHQYLQQHLKVRDRFVHSTQS